MDEKQSSNKVPVIPTLLITSALHNRLIKENLRTDCNVVVNTASARDNHQISINQIGFGATCVHPWLGLQSVLKVSNDSTELTSNELCVAYRKCLNKGLLKIMSKMGISNVSSYRGSGLFEVIGFSDKGKTIFVSQKMNHLLKENHSRKFMKKLCFELSFDGDDDRVAKGLHKFKHNGEDHAFNPDVCNEFTEFSEMQDLSKNLKIFFLR